MINYLRHNQAALKKREQDIYQHLFQSTIWKNARTIGVTLSMPHEINTYPIIEQAWQEGKYIAVPKTFPETHQLKFYRLQNFNDLRRGFKNIYEPICTDSKIISSNIMDMIIVPGLVYDYSGYRIGYGGGFFDRYLADYTNIKVAILYQAQLKPAIPRDSFDIPVDILITEKKYCCVKKVNDD
ncbi:5-formyltetrahydrofolate cyclo-ligase [Saliterribacillus persicus]|uniref:5-formyltetrahydrofolate cyclo-ligase n=2 Tax=Saliterribacillus persicus TaxID=930114 RepID=A0A368XCD7_9BACI|nr:5-formyltetrahydrofolate cyclo-ligase [Saliterribacillus persicus]